MDQTYFQEKWLDDAMNYTRKMEKWSILTDYLDTKVKMEM